jgi:glycogen(starch) synthase
MNPPRLLLLNHEFPPVGGGGGQASRHLARELAAQGHQVTVITGRFGNQPWREEAEGFSIRRLPVLRRRLDRSHPLEMLTFAWSGRILVPQIIQECRPEAVVAFFALPAGLLARHLRKRYGLPYLVSLRGGDVPGFLPEAYGRLHRLAAPLLRRVGAEAACLVANSPGLAQLAREFWRERRDSMSFIPNGVDPQSFFPGPPRPAAPPLKVVTAGRLTPQKGVDRLLEALAQLPPRDRAASLLTVIGDGPHRGRLAEQARHLGVSERVRFTGWLSREEIRTQFQGSHLFALLSRAEGMSNALLEAMACGLPVIATAAFGSTELVQPEHNGFLVPMEDRLAVAGYWRQLLQTPELLASLGQNSLNLARSFSWQRVGKAYGELLNGMLS